jgi:aminoglycoside phosphotransferase (APT) family kinase protein
MSLDSDAVEDLDALLRRVAGVAGVESATQLTGGASRQTFLIEATAGDAGGDPVGYVLQRETAAEPRLPNGMADEADLVAAAGRAGVPAPTVVACNRDGGRSLGSSFFITEQVEGETIARRILRDDRFERARAALPAQLGQALAALHTSVDPASVPWLEETDELARYREVADELDLVSPAFELAFRWLEANRPDRSASEPAVVHGDFRLGNLIIDEQGLAAVIDWELGHLGDPMEDLGWVCVRAWRFGGPGPVAGVGQYEEFFAAYEQASGTPVDRDAVRWWETLGTLKWGIMCGTQSNRHLSGDVPSVELAAIGPRVAEQEYDVLGLIIPDSPTADSDGGPASWPERRPDRALATGAAEGGGRPTAVELIDAVRGFLLGDVSDATDGRTRFHALVAANALATVARDLDLGQAIERRRSARLADLGVDSERALAAEIRSGRLDDRFDQVAAAVLASVTDRLMVNNPNWLGSRSD